MRRTKYRFVVATAALVVPLYAFAQPAKQDPPADDADTVGAGSAAGSAGSATGSAAAPAAGSGSGSGVGSAAGSAAAPTPPPVPPPVPPQPPTTPPKPDDSKLAAPPPVAKDSRDWLSTLFGGARRTSLIGWTDVDYSRYDISVDELSAGTREPLNQDKFQVRRAHLHLDNDWDYVGYTAEVNFFAKGYTARPTSFDVHAQLPGKNGDPPLLKVKAGLFPVPFTYQNLSQWSFQIFFAERATFVDAFIPGRFDIGVAASGHIWQIDWILAAQNGEPLDSPTFAYQDPNSAKDYSGRLEINGDLVGGVHAATGMSFLDGTGFSPGTAPTKDSFVWRDLNEDGRVQLTELISVPGAPGRPSKDFTRWGLAGDLRVWRDIPRLGELRVDAELALAKNLDRYVAPADPVLLGRDQRGLGFYASITQYVTEHAQVGFRYDYYQPDIDELEMYNGRVVLTRRKFQTYTTGISGRLRLSDKAFARLHLEYAYQKNSLGRDAAGRPTQLDNGATRVRFEVVF